MTRELFSNQALIAGLIAWFLGQFLKVPIEYLLRQKISWGLWFSSGGMPSSHSSLMTATTLSIGLNYGFDEPAFAIAVAISMIVLYDATGVRRQAGLHAQKINQIFEEVLHGKPIDQKKLKEVLGHTPKQVVGGTLLGIAVAVILWYAF